MAPLPTGTASLAAGIKFPVPDNPADPDSDFVLTNENARQIRALFIAIIDYIAVEYERCGIKPAS